MFICQKVAYIINSRLMSEDNLKKYFGLKLKYYRNKLNITQEVFSEKIGITQRQMSLIELGKSFPSPKTISKIASFLNCPVSDLFDFKLIKETKITKSKLSGLIENLPEEKLKILYIIAKNI